MQMSRSSSDRGKTKGVENSEWAAELVEKVVTFEMHSSAVRKTLKSQPPEVRMDLEWRLVRHSGFPAQLFSTHLWFTDSALLVAEFVTSFRGSVERDRVAILNTVAWWITYFPHTTIAAHGQLAELVAAAECDPMLSTLDSVRVLRGGFPPDEPPAEAHKPGLAIPAIDVFHPDRSQGGGDGAGAAADPAWILAANAKDLAAQLTVLDTSLLVRVQSDEFRVQTRAGTKGLMVTSVLGSVITHTNNLRAQFVRLILSHTDVEERVAAVEHIVDIGRHLLELNNFLSLFAVAGAMTHSAVSRLKLTTALLPKSTLKVIAMMELVLSPNHNHEAYRQRLNTAPHGLPYLGIVLKDLTGLYGLDGWSDDKSTLNFTKYRGVARVLLAVTSAVGRATHFVADNVDDDDDLIRSVLELASTCPADDKLYAISLEREPRGQTVTRQSRSKSMSRGTRNRRRTVSANDQDAINLALVRKTDRSGTNAAAAKGGDTGVVGAARAAVAAAAERKRFGDADTAELKSAAAKLITELLDTAAPPRLVKSIELLLVEMQRRIEGGAPPARSATDSGDSDGASIGSSLRACSEDEPDETRGGGPVGRTMSESDLDGGVSSVMSRHISTPELGVSRGRTYTIEEEECTSGHSTPPSSSNAETSYGSAMSAPPVLVHFTEYGQHFWAHGDDSDDSELDLDDVFWTDHSTNDTVTA